MQRDLDKLGRRAYTSYMNEMAVASTESRVAPCADHVMFSLIQLGRAMEQRVEQALAEVGLSGAKFGALSHLVQVDAPLSLSECAARMTCVRSNVTQLMDRLEADGLVRRVEDRSDRRAVRAVVTPLGRERHAEGQKRIEKLKQDLSRTLAQVNRDAIERVLAAMR